MVKTPWYRFYGLDHNPGPSANGHVFHERLMAGFIADVERLGG
jgi:hypothetical protein